MVRLLLSKYVTTDKINGGLIIGVGDYSHSRHLQRLICTIRREYLSPVPAQATDIYEFNSFPADKKSGVTPCFIKQTEIVYFIFGMME